MTFKEVAVHSDVGDRYLSLIRIMLVCRRWHNIVIGNTILWSDIIVSGVGGAEISRCTNAVRPRGLIVLRVGSDV